MGCARKNRARENPSATVEFACLWCGTVFKRAKNNVEQRPDRVKFCSRECNGAHTIRYKQNRVSATESDFLDRLESAGLKVSRQKRIAGFIVDAVCSTTNVAIEFDGEYWHSLKHIKAKDERKAQAIAWAGYKLVRVPERDWLDNPEATIAWVLEEIQRL